MSLENAMSENNLLKRFKEKVLPYLAIAGLGFAQMGCPINPGSISVQNTITSSPNALSMQKVFRGGSNLDWKVTVTNNGSGELKIKNATFYEKAISGWASTEPYNDGNLPITVTDIAPYSSEVIFDRSASTNNPGPGDVTYENVVTIYSNEGKYLGTCNYTVSPQN